MNMPVKKAIFRMEVTRDSFLAACNLFRKTIRSKRDQAKDVILCLGEEGFSVTWGNTSIDLSAKGVWPVPVSIPGPAFFSVVKFPLSADPLVFKIKDERFFCGGWSCAFYIDESAPDLFTPEVVKPASSQSKPSRGSKRKPAPLAKRSFTPQELSQTINMTKPVRNILDDFENIRENLLAFSDDVWLDIDHNDAQSLEEGVLFKKRLNTQIDAFGKLSEAMTRLIQEYTKIQTEGEPSADTEIGSTQAENSRIIKELNKNEPHSIDEDFTYKRPFGFVLDDVGYQDIRTWSRVYELILRQLSKKDPVIFKALPENPETITKQNNSRFSRDPAQLRKALLLPHAIYAETNLSANHICASIRSLLDIFFLPASSCTLFLRQDRDA